MDTAANWTAGSPWGLTSSTSHSDGLCFTDSPAGNYANNADTSLTMTNLISLPAGATALSFWTHYNLESGYNYGSVQVSSNGGPWTTIGSRLTGQQATWTQVSYSLAAYSGQNVQIRFRLTSDSSVTHDGWYVDDVSIATIDSQTGAKMAIDAMEPTDSTSIGARVQAADGELDRFPSDSVRAMLVMTDGLQNTDPEPIDVINSQVDPNIRIYTIGYGSDADSSLLAQMADLRGGRYYFAPSSNELREIYSAIAGNLSGQQELMSATGTVAQGDTTTQTATVDSSVSQVRFEVDWTGSDMDLSLVSPDGTVIDHNTAASCPGVTLDIGSTYEFYTIDSPQAGQWTMRVLGVDIPAGTENYHAYVAATAGIQMSASTNKNTYSLSEPVHIVASLTDGTPICGGNVIATVTAPAGASPTTTDVVLYDDGAHGDGAANDGVYANDFTGLNCEGSYNVTVNASGVANDGSSFTRTSFQSIAVWPCTVTIDKATGQPNPTNTSPVHFIVHFSDPVSNFTAGDVTLGGTAGANRVLVTDSGDHMTYDVAVSGMTGNGTVTADIPAGIVYDAAGNANLAAISTDNTVTYNTTNPTVTINQATGQADPTNSSPINFTVVFSEPVTDFSTSDVTLSGTVPGTLVGTVTGSGTTYNVAVSGMTGAERSWPGWRLGSRTMQRVIRPWLPPARTIP